MKESYLRIMDEECGHLAIDAKLVKKLDRYMKEFINRNENHVLYFSNPYMGVWPARYTPNDKLKFFDTVMDASDVAIGQRVRNIPGVGTDWIRVTDPVNVASVWLAYKFMNSGLPKRQAEEGAKAAIIILHIKFLTSLDARYFPHGVDIATAQAAYNSLSYKFSLKKYGSWLKLFEARAEEIISLTSIHKKTLEKFDDKGVIDMISDLQVRVRSIVKHQYAAIDATRASDASILTKSSVININGDLMLREIQRNETRYIRYLEAISHDHRRFVKEDLVVVTSHAMPTMPMNAFDDILKYITEMSGTMKGRDVDEFLKNVILHAISYLTGDRSASAEIRDTYTFIRKLRQSYTAARYRDPLFLKMKEQADKIIRPRAKTRNDALISAIRTGLFIYIVLRVFAIDHYK